MSSPPCLRPSAPRRACPLYSLRVSLAPPRPALRSPGPATWGPRPPEGYVQELPASCGLDPGPHRACRGRASALLRLEALA